MKKQVYLDILERVAWTFIQAFAAAVVIAGFTKEGFAVAATAAGISAFKCIAATQVGDSDSAATLPGKV